jgi:vacuolar-type H+-ATPase subunit I/STV1
MTSQDNASDVNSEGNLLRRFAKLEQLYESLATHNEHNTAKVQDSLLRISALQHELKSCETAKSRCIGVIHQLTNRVQAQMERMREAQETNARAMELEGKVRMLESELDDTRAKLKWAEEFRGKAEEEAAQQTRKANKLRTVDQRLARERERVNLLVEENKRLTAQVANSSSSTTQRGKKKRSKAGN